MSGFPQPHDNQPLPPGWIKEWDANHNAWYFVDTRQTPPVTTWNDPRSIASGPPPVQGDGERGLMGSIGQMMSGKQANSNNNYTTNPYPQQPYNGNYNQSGYQGNYNQPPAHQYNGGQASSYYNQVPPSGGGYQPSPAPNAGTKPSGAGGGLGSLLSKIPGGGTGGGGAGSAGGAGALLSKLPGMLNGGGSKPAGGSGGGSSVNPLMAGVGGAAAAALAGKLLGGHHGGSHHSGGHHGGGHHGGGLMGMIPGHGHHHHEHHHGHHHGHHHHHHHE